VSIFPGVAYKMVIQLTRNITELFHAYFLTQDTPHLAVTDEGPPQQVRSLAAVDAQPFVCGTKS
jgi:hypothetical protein